MECYPEKRECTHLYPVKNVHVQILQIQRDFNGIYTVHNM